MVENLNLKRKHRSLETISSTSGKSGKPTITHKSADSRQLLVSSNKREKADLFVELFLCLNPCYFNRPALMQMIHKHPANDSALFWGQAGHHYLFLSRNGLTNERK